jgi:hypothetical protein
MNLLIKRFAIPPGSTSGSPDDLVIRSEEGQTASVSYMNSTMARTAAPGLV